MNRKPRIIFIHGNQSTHWSYGWAPWLKQKLEAAGYPTFFETFPDSIIARAEYWLPFLKEHVCAGEEDVIVGWSSGAVAAMRYTETEMILGSVLISPCYTDTGDALEKESGYYESPWEWQKIKQNQKHIALVYGEDDPIIPQTEFEHIAQQLTPKIIALPKAGHFTKQQTFPEVLSYLLETYK